MTKDLVKVSFFYQNIVPNEIPEKQVKFQLQFLSQILNDVLIEKIKLIEETFPWFLSVPKIGYRLLIEIERKTENF